MKEGAWLYGLNPVLEAVRAGRSMVRICISAARRKGHSEIEALARDRGLKVEIIRDPGFFDRRFPKGHQGVAAEALAARPRDLDEVLRASRSRPGAALFVVLDEVEDPRNVGAVIRTAEAAGAHAVIAQERRGADVYGPTVSKTSAGAVEHIPLVVVSNVKNAIDRMREEGIAIIGAEAAGDAAPWEMDLTLPLALVIGSESGGLRRIIRERCDRIASLPMHGRVNSLNASVAAGVLIYEILRQRSARQPLIPPAPK